MIAAADLSVALGGRMVVRGVSVRIAAGEVVVLVGANGAGKSTLLRVLGGELRPTGGVATYNGVSLARWSPRELARMRAFLPQRSMLAFPFTALEVVLMGRAPHVTSRETAADHAAARAALAAVGLCGVESRLYPRLSGGEQQRVQIARALAQIWEPAGPGGRALLLDEPTANLDLVHQHGVLRLARRLADAGVAVIAVLHDLHLAAQYADGIVVMEQGRVCAAGTPGEVLRADVLSRAFRLPLRVIAHPAGYPLVIPDPDALATPECAASRRGKSSGAVRGEVDGG